MNNYITSEQGARLKLSISSNYAPTSNFALDHLPPLPSLIGWSHRPQAIAKCFISDIYRMQALVNLGTEGMQYASRDVFLLNQFPCKMIEIVAWVCGVDHKDTSMTVTLDDGDGQYVLPTLLRLHPTTSSSNAHVFDPTLCKPAAQTFPSASERRLAKRKATEELLAFERSQKMKWAPIRQYTRKDIRTGDTVRIVGKIDEWMRRKADGSSEWVRQVVVDENAGGSICVVDPDEQYTHTAEVHNLHQTIYSRHFTLPRLNVANQGPTITPSKNGSKYIIDPNVSDSFGMTLTSEAPSELSMIDAEPELRDPNKLRSSQLTDRTFRQYMLDYMTQETIKSVLKLTEISQMTLNKELEILFPEHRQARLPFGKNTRSRTSLGVFQPSTRVNSAVEINRNKNPRGLPTTPTQRSFDSKRSNSSCSSGLKSREWKSSLKAFMPSTISENERLQTLARLVVENEVRKEERRRRRRMREGKATRKDLDIELDRKEGKIQNELCEKEILKKMDRLVNWAIRAISEEGSLVQITLSRNGINEYGYLPLPCQLLFTLCIPHLKREKELRKNTIRRKSDPKSNNGMTIDELTDTFKSWGIEGRWERLGDWIVEDAVEWGLSKGYLKKEGNGYWLNDDYDDFYE
ncbi:uncharacterized protein I206_103725 [Kwoniella pini CBS 10737]|uniref:CST complex subunit Stn1 N-terminal domain-containing protein n=1 Tax=Kwoniella pini CBS 10737 TaxID=1296096 RepID=A0A1B9I8Z0_9TREE|nr:uncharacterized protein I206_01274 [Kwoniella pini CBS 10737]OCF51990.1 hypothetical protein I206_01274 [Kwoniella pini CBS 10737]